MWRTHGVPWFVVVYEARDTPAGTPRKGTFRSGVGDKRTPAATGKTAAANADARNRWIEPNSMSAGQGLDAMRGPPLQHRTDDEGNGS
jgi:hypothetical protein